MHSLGHLRSTFQLRRQLVSSLRFSKLNYSSKNDNSDKDKELAKKDEDKAVFQVNRKTSSSAPADMPIDQGIQSLMKKDNKPYVPKLRHDRLSYDMPGMPNQDEFTKFSNKVQKPKTVTRWSRYMPKVLAALLVLWGGYTVKVWYFPSEKGSDSKELLDPDHFHPFKVTHVKQVDEDHFLIEVVPKFKNWQYSYYANYEGKTIWNGDRLWSVEIMQPQIQIVRSYTPLPLYFMKSERTRSGEEEPLLRIIDNDREDYDKGGVMTFYIKKYDDGEMSRYLTSRKVGDIIDIRGPYTDYKFPHHPLKQFHQRPMFRDLPSKVEAESLLPVLKKENNLPDFDNLNFFGAGTGLAPILQCLFSRNPYRGFVDVHYSAHKPSELEPFRRYLFFLEKLDRIRLQTHYDSQPKTALSSKDIQKPSKPNFLSSMRVEQSMEKKEELSEEDKLKLRMAIMRDTKEEKQSKDTVPAEETQRVPRYENALHQAQHTAAEPKTPPSLAVVCGPDGYVDYVAGKKLLETNEQGDVAGLLGKKGWDNSNVFKL
ncbi:hypothetical protein CXQ85_003992 [Candidozyma haemuli]|uniref:FAD-binding FR-type domain-containing protein n=1 Tax=Candidozyma haemuli TaxID=45357 RepID=A0A2V1B055_9ASCO|nr:hypothetical protein CXQ85_003992 [[Candida] haemuloni]PVH23700.1 hypothetical protein CXQ85_003992 [[Candida] haemuloni]